MEASLPFIKGFCDTIICDGNPDCQDKRITSGSDQMGKQLNIRVAIYAKEGIVQTP